MKGETNIISEKQEDYVLTIFRLIRGHGHAHLSELARLRGVKNSSANAALNSLNEKGLVVYEKYRPIMLTEKGETLATRMLERRKTLMRFFEGTLGVETGEAKKTVCKVEHLFDDGIMDKLSRLMDGPKSRKTHAKKI